MKNLKKLLIITIFSLIFQIGVLSVVQGQNIGINEPNPDNSAILEMTSTERGLLIPRMTTAQRDAIDVSGNPNSVMIFNTTTECFEFYYNGSWYNIACTCTPPDIPVATAGSGALETQFTANWNAATGATSYYLDVSENSSFSSFVTGYNNLDVGNVTTKDVTGLTCETTYYYRVRAYNDCGTTGNSNTITYATSACCSGGPPTSGCGGLTTMTDARDGKVYNIVEIPSGQCWMAENLNYGTYVTVATGQGGAGTQKYCYDNSTSKCTTYGGLYEWAEMMDGSTTCNGGAACPPCATNVQGICPAGWHVPSHYEWTLLEKNVGTDPGAFLYDETTTGSLGIDEGGNLKVTYLWESPNTGATNSSGFTAFPGGGFWSGSFNNVGYYGFWWSATEYDATNAWYRHLFYSSAAVTRYHVNKADAYSVRCVKD